MQWGVNFLHVDIMAVNKLVRCVLQRDEVVHRRFEVVLKKDDPTPLFYRLDTVSVLSTFNNQLRLEIINDQNHNLSH